MDTGDRLLTPGEVAALFRVDPKTVTRWAAAGRIGSHPHARRAPPVPRVRGSALLEGEGMLDEAEGLANQPRNTGPNQGVPGQGNSGPY